MGSLLHWEQAFGSVGWFIPPYVQMGVLHEIAGEIQASAGSYSQEDLEAALSRLYEAYGMAAMVVHRYPIAPVIKDYQESIAEAIEAHFAGLHHVAAAGLIPVIEGAGKRLAAKRGFKPDDSVKAVFRNLAEDCKSEIKAKSMGDQGELESMLDSFTAFLERYMYVNSAAYPLADKTNRHGIAHGAYTDRDYGRPLNFYKAIAAIDFLTFVAAMNANLSWLAPNVSEVSVGLAEYYGKLAALGQLRVR